MKDQASIKAIHADYVQLTGMEVSLTIPRMDAWQTWLECGWTAEDLALVVRHRKTLWSKEHVLPSFKFGRFIEDRDRFEESLAEARAWRRQLKTNYDKARVLRATGRSDAPKLPQPQQVGDVLKGKKALEELRRLRDSL